MTGIFGFFYRKTMISTFYKVRNILEGEDFHFLKEIFECSDSELLLRSEMLYVNWGPHKYRRTDLFVCLLGCGAPMLHLAWGRRFAGLAF